MKQHLHILLLEMFTFIGSVGSHSYKWLIRFKRDWFHIELCQITCFSNKHASIQSVEIHAVSQYKNTMEPVKCGFVIFEFDAKIIVLFCHENDQSAR